MAVIPGILASSITGHLVTSNFFKIATVTAAGGETSLSFTSIPSTYKSLQIRVLSKDTDTTYNGFTSAILRFNSDSTTGHYSYHRLNTSSGSVVAYGNGSTSSISLDTLDASSGSGMTNIFAGGIIDVIDYASTTKYKTLKYLGGFDNNSTGGGISLVSGLWQSTSAVTSLSIASNDVAWAAGTTFTLYGVS
jgi:hypothetical protein